MRDTNVTAHKHHFIDGVCACGLLMFLPEPSPSASAPDGRSTIDKVASEIFEANACEYKRCASDARECCCRDFAHNAALAVMEAGLLGCALPAQGRSGPSEDEIAEAIYASEYDTDSYPWAKEPDKLTYRTMARAVLKLLTTPSPAGGREWQTVPREPTHEMFIAGRSAGRANSRRNGKDYRLIYRAMLNAAPAAAGPAPQGPSERCPRPANGAPDNLTVGQCVARNECCCDLGAALAATPSPVEGHPSELAAKALHLAGRLRDPKNLYDGFIREDTAQTLERLAAEGLVPQGMRDALTEAVEWADQHGGEDVYGWPWFLKARAALASAPGEAK